MLSSEGAADANSKCTLKLCRHPKILMGECLPSSIRSIRQGHEVPLGSHEEKMSIMW